MWPSASGSKAVSDGSHRRSYVSHSPPAMLSSSCWFRVRSSATVVLGMAGLTREGRKGVKIQGSATRFSGVISLTLDPLRYFGSFPRRPLILHPMLAFLLLGRGFSARHPSG